MKSYVGTNVYNEALKRTININAHEDYRSFIAEIAASFNHLHPEFDMNKIYDNIESISSVDFKDLRFIYTGEFYGKNEENASRIVMDDRYAMFTPYKSFNTRSVFVHEVLHGFADKENYNGVFSGPEFLYINEALNEYHTCSILKDLGDDYTVVRTVKDSLDNLKREMSYASYSTGYTNIVHLGEMLYNINPELSFNSQFGEMNLNDSLYNKLIVGQNEKFGLLLQDLLNSDLAKMTIDNETESLKVLHNMLYQTYSDVSWDLYIENSQDFFNKMPKFKLDEFSYSPIAENMKCADIMAWAKQEGMDVSLLNRELNPETRSQAIEDFANCCQILRQADVNMSYDNIKSLTFSKMETDEIINYKIFINGKELNADFMKINNQSFYINDYDAIMINTNTPKNIGFNNSDINSESISVSYNDIFNEVSKYSNGFFHSEILESINPDIAKAYAIMDGYTLNDKIPENIDLLMLAAKNGSMEAYFESVYEHANKDEIRRATSIAMANGEIRFGLNLLCADYAFQESSSKIHLDISAINKAMDIDILKEIYKFSPDTCAKIIDEQHLNIDEYEGKKLVAFILQDKDEGNLNIMTSYKWLIEHNVDLNTSIASGYIYIETLKDEIAFSGTIDDVKNMVVMERFKSSLNNSSNVLLNAVRSNEEPYEKVKILLDNGVDINAKGFENATATHQAIRMCMDIYNGHQTKDSESYKTLGLLIDSGADMSIRECNKYTAAEELAMGSNIELVKFGIEHGIKFEDVFTKDVLDDKYFYNGFSDDEMKELKEISEKSSNLEKSSDIEL